MAKNKRYCPECGAEVDEEFIYETGGAWCTCPDCGWEGPTEDTEDESGVTERQRDEEEDAAIDAELEEYFKKARQFHGN